MSDMAKQLDDVGARATSQAETIRALADERRVLTAERDRYSLALQDILGDPRSSHQARVRALDGLFGAPR